MPNHNVNLPVFPSELGDPGSTTPRLAFTTSERVARGVFSLQEPVIDGERPFLLVADDRTFFVEAAVPTHDRGNALELAQENGRGRYRRYRMQAFEQRELTDADAIVGAGGSAALYDGSALDRLQSAESPVGQWFNAKYSPTSLIATPRPLTGTDFRLASAYGEYNWELYYHAPMLVARKLTAAGRFEAAQKWLRRVIDPTRDDGSPWRFRPFRELPEVMTPLIRSLGSEVDTLRALRAQIEASANDPYDPHAIARLRPAAYQLAAVAQYVDNLIAWGDSRFEAYTAESLNEATLHYETALSVLGPRPMLAACEGSETDPLADLLGNDDTSVEFENRVYPAPFGRAQRLMTDPGAVGDLVALAPPFVVPFNKQMLRLWDVVEDRLAKIRDGRDITGAKRRVALWAPPIDPALLVRAVAAGLSIADAIAAATASRPHVRYRALIARAKEAASNLRSLGASLLGYLEKRDGEALATLQATQTEAVLALQEAIHSDRIAESEAALKSLRERRAAVQARRDWYRSRERRNSLEKKEVRESDLANKEQKRSEKSSRAGSIIGGVDISAGWVGTSGPAFHTTLGTSTAAAVIRGITEHFSIRSARHSRASAAAARDAANQRRWEDWKFQAEQAEAELRQIEHDEVAALLRIAIAGAERDVAKAQVEHQQETLAFMRGKFSNKQLYDWLVASVRSLHHLAHRSALQLANWAAEAAEDEFGVTGVASIVSPSSQDRSREGLLAGERLSADLDKLEMRVLTETGPRHEIVINIALSELNARELIKLRSNASSMSFAVAAGFLSPTWGIGTNTRLTIRSVAVTVVGAQGPYDAVALKLALADQGVPSPREVLLSHGANDFGRFEPSMSDERYLPFERANLVGSEWTLSPCSSSANHAGVVDVVLHVRAEVGVDLPADPPADPTARWRLLTARGDFAAEWAAFEGGSFVVDVSAFVNGTRATEPAPATYQVDSAGAVTPLPSGASAEWMGSVLTLNFGTNPKPKDLLIAVAYTTP